MKTINFSAEIGIYEGYNVDANGKETTGIEAIAKLLKEAQSKIHEETGIYVSTIVKGPNRTCYNTDGGCPEGGEVTYTISSTANPKFAPDLNKWKEAALKLMNEMRTILRQTTVSVEFHEPDGVDFYYLDSDRAIDEYLNPSKALVLETLEKYLPEDFIEETKCHTINHDTVYDLLCELALNDKEKKSLIQIGTVIEDDVDYKEIMSHMLTKDIFEAEADKRLQMLIEIKYQMQEVQKGLNNGLDVSKYANLTPEGKFIFDSEQMYEIRSGLEAGVDVNVYTNPKYNWLQMNEIRQGLEKDLDINQFAALDSKGKPVFDCDRMRVIRIGLKKGVDVSKITVLNSEGRPVFDSEQMTQIVKGLINNVDVSKYTALNSNGEPTYRWDEMRKIRIKLEEEIKSQKDTPALKKDEEYIDF